jgi:hypothetical protein
MLILFGLIKGERKTQIRLSRRNQKKSFLLKDIVTGVVLEGETTTTGGKVNI